ncbi:MAG: bifunctional oligoribonuclease/PAP phosphatase NrnA [Clostridia bacterium]|nr:bifunctional oligoribonuclease/PAP phosphatase NrnA [Clostridia bacterium]
MKTKVVELLKSAESVAIYSHINSDCDAMGSSLALKEALEILGKKVDVYSNSNFPASFAFYGDLSFVNKKTQDKYDLAVCLDTANEARLGKFKFTYRKGVKNVLVIDHHHTANEKYGKVNYVLQASATAEMLYDIIVSLGVKINTKISKFLLSGILTDTGKFTHSVNENTFVVVSKLLAVGGFSIEDVVNPIFNSMSNNSFQMLKRVYNYMKFYCGGRFALVVLRRSDFIETGTTLDDTDAFPDLPLQLESVKFCILASEDDKGYFRVSFRSKGEISARAVAESFGGGGHLNASGCKIFGEYEDVKQKLIDSTLSVLGWKND